MDLSPNCEPVDKKTILTADGLIQNSGNSNNSASGGQNTLTASASRLDIEILPEIFDIIRW